MQYFLHFGIHEHVFTQLLGTTSPRHSSGGGALSPASLLEAQPPDSFAPPLLHGLLDPPLSLAADARCVVGDVSLC